ncbi:MAG: DMT family transporter [Actinomycetota bacterium]
MRLDLLAALSGILIAAQSRVNGGLSAALGNSTEAAVYSFGSGFLLLNIIALANPKVRQGVRRIVAGVKSGELPAWRLSAGIMGGIFVAIQTFTVPIIGVALLSVVMIAGQTLASLIVDRIGITGGGKQPITLRRVLAAAITIFAVLVATWEEIQLANISPAPIIIVFVGGFMIGVQRALNGQINDVSGQSFSTTWLNFFMGTSTLVILLIINTARGEEIVGLPTSPWWIYWGGTIGVLYIASSSVIVAKIGVLSFTLFATGGQLIGSLIFDLIAPPEDVTIGINLVLGILITYIGVLVGGLRKQGSIRTRSTPNN